MEKLIQKELEEFKADCSIYDAEYATTEALRKLWKHYFKLEAELKRNRKC